MEEIYLDNNATTKCDEEVYDAMKPYLENQYGNPSSIYSFGTSIKAKIEKARKKVAELLNADESEIIFTSCASESNVTAIMSAIRSFPNKKQIITTKVEHASIMETMKYLESIGYTITYLQVDTYGRISLEELERTITDSTCLITIMMANNELGNIYPIKEIGKIAEKHNILFHTDAVQAVGKISIDVRELGVTTLSLSGHKIHAPKGIGVLYVKKGIPFMPLIFGHQESNHRGGTENVAHIVGLGKAIELIMCDNDNTNRKLKELRDFMEIEIQKNNKDVVIYGDLQNRLPNTSSIAFKGVNAEELLLLLESFNIFVSTGSACNAKNIEPSHVLMACNANLKEFSPIRVSLSKYNTKEEIEKFVETLSRVVEMLRKRN